MKGLPEPPDSPTAMASAASLRRITLVGKNSPPGECLPAWRKAIGNLVQVAADPEDIGRFHGDVEVWATARVVLSRVGSTRLRLQRSPGANAGDRLDHFACILVETGSLAGTAGTTEIALQAGDIAFFDLLQTLTLQTSIEGGVTGNIALWVPRTRLQSSVRDEHLLHGTVLRGSGPAGRLVAANLRTLAENGNTMNEQDLDVLADGAIELAARAVAPVLQSVAKTGTTAPLDSLVTIRRYVDRHLMSPALTPNSIARTFGLSRASLYRLFEPVGGIAGYIREARLRRAYQQITTQQESGRRIGQIAYGLGFKNVGTFNRLFRKTYGFNPGEARRLSAVTPNAFLKTEDHEMSLAGCLRQIGGQ